MTTTVPYRHWPPVDEWNEGVVGGKAAFVQMGAGRVWWQADSRTGPNVWSASLSPDHAHEGLTPWIRPPWRVKSRVHSYGGRAFAVDREQLWFVTDKAQLASVSAPGAPPEVLWSQEGVALGGVGVIGSGATDRLLYAVCDDQRESSVVHLWRSDGRIWQTIRAGDFCAAPVVSPDGRFLALMGWDNPYMPWQRSRLCCFTRPDLGAPFELTDTLDSSLWRSIVSVFVTDTEIWIVSDAASDHWDLYRWSHGHRACGSPKPVLAVGGDLGLAPWQIGVQTLAVLAGGALISMAHIRGTGHTIAWPCEGEPRRVHWRWPDGRPLVLSDVSDLTGQDRSLAVIGRGHDLPWRVLWAQVPPLPWTDQDLIMTVRGVWPSDPSENQTMRAVVGNLETTRQSITVVTPDQRKTHAHYCGPFQHGYRAPDGDRPALVVRCHGGPTAHALPAFDPAIARLTSRGLAHVDVNFTGSTSYGRSYRDALRGAWGEIDVTDVRAVVSHLAQAGWIDAHRVVLMGSSAGGLTAILTAMRWRGAGRLAGLILRYPVVDLVHLRSLSPRFERHYLDWLVGSWPCDLEGKALSDPPSTSPWRTRSPIQRSTESLGCPVLVFHGRDDAVVPLSQVERWVEGLQQGGQDAQLHVLEGEGHGFRSAQARQEVERVTDQFLRSIGVLGDVEPGKVFRATSA